jgi:nucleotide-binding universal stress UspA family protein
VTTGTGKAELPVTRVVLEGSAAEQLVERAKGASLLVLGNRGRGGFRGLLLGSVAHQCAAHAQCPVVIVPQPHTRNGGPDEGPTR